MLGYRNVNKVLCYQQKQKKNIHYYFSLKVFNHKDPNILNCKEVLVLFTCNHKEVLVVARILRKQPAISGKKFLACGCKKKFLRMHYFWAVL